jgi:hypothetical protein
VPITSHTNKHSLCSSTSERDSWCPLLPSATAGAHNHTHIHNTHTACAHLLLSATAGAPYYLVRQLVPITIHTYTHSLCSSTSECDSWCPLLPSTTAGAHNFTHIHNTHTACAHLLLNATTGAPYYLVRQLVPIMPHTYTQLMLIHYRVRQLVPIMPHTAHHNLARQLVPLMIYCDSWCRAITHPPSSV